MSTQRPSTWCLERHLDWPYHFPGRLFPFKEVKAEAAVLQVLATDRMASVDEGCIVTALRSDLNRGAVAKWAERFSGQCEFTWDRCPLFGDVLFSLKPD